MQPQFVHLKCHSEFSLVDGLVRVKDLVAATKADQMPAVAVTDLNNLFALVKFYKACLANKIKPIIGSELDVRDDNCLFRVTVLCMNNAGYRHLTELVSRAYTEGQKRTGQPEVELDWLLEKNAGLIVLSGGSVGDVGQALLKQESVKARQLAQRWQTHFPNRYYIELARTQKEGESSYLHAALALAEELVLPVVAVNDVRFMSADDFDAHEARVCIHAGYALDDPKRPHNYSREQYYKTQQEMQSLFEDIPEALINAVSIAERCTVTLTLGEVFLPQFPVPAGLNLEQYLRQEVESGLDRYWRGAPSSHNSYEDYQARLDIELDVINRMGFPGYFLIVADFIRWAKENDIPVGPGRGSGAGSLVAFCLGITMLDPLEHHLLFERFLNPERVSMPDFDIDFCMERRDEVIEYVARRYGQNAVSQIITYGTMAAKAVVRDVGRVLGYPYGMVDKIAKLIPFEIGMTLTKAMEQEEVLRERVESEEEVGVLMDLALKLEGVSRNAGKHAGGVVIAPSKLTDFTAIYCEPSGEHPVSQFDKDDVESVGLVKFDFLGLRTLTIIHWALTAINARLKKQGSPVVNIDAIPLDDEKTFSLMQSCATTAVFQLESRGMKELIGRLQPHSFDEITALVALFRPGPLQSGMVDDFINRKHGRAEVDYPHPDLEPILKSTYGVILYQEQVMKIAQVLARYSLGGADILRRAMGKKKPEEMAKQREVFRKGATENDIEEKVSMRIFDLMEKFAGYGFNKSHSAAYALIAYQTAYLKAHFPAEFMAAVLSSDMDNTDKVVIFLQECKSMGLTVLSPNVNLGWYAFYVNEKGEIVYGLGAIKGVGQAACELIDEERQQGGDYQSLFDLCQRLDMRKVSRRALEPLIYSGSLDVFGKTRAILLASVDQALHFAEQKHRDDACGQHDLFSFDDAAIERSSPVDYVVVSPWQDADRLQFEKTALGYFLSGHPFDIYKMEIQQLNVVSLKDLQRYINNKAKVAGVLVSQRIVMTKRGKKMAILALEDHSEKIEVTVFPRLLDQVFDKCVVDGVLVVQGKVESDNYSGKARIVAETICSLEEIRNTNVRRLLLTLPDRVQAEELIAQLPLLIKPYCGGHCPVYIDYQGEKARAQFSLGASWKVTLDAELIKQLRYCCGEQHVLLEYS